MCQNVIREPSFAKDPVAALKKGFLRTDHEVRLGLSALSMTPWTVS